MNLFIFVVMCTLASIAVAAQSVPSKEEAVAALRTLLAECKEKTGATDADVQTVLKHETGTMEAKCLGACILKKMDVMDSNGKIVKAVALKIAEIHTENDARKMQTVGELMDACDKSADSDNHCIAAEQYSVCMTNEINKRGLDGREFDVKF